MNYTTGTVIINVESGGEISGGGGGAGSGGGGGGGAGGGGGGAGGEAAQSTCMAIYWGNCTLTCNRHEGQGGAGGTGCTGGTGTQGGAGGKGAGWTNGCTSNYASFYSSSGASLTTPSG